MKKRILISLILVCNMLLVGCVTNNEDKQADALSVETTNHLTDTEQNNIQLENQNPNWDEKAIISEALFTARYGKEYAATLFYLNDGTIRLNVHHSEVVIVSNVDTDALGYYDDSNVPKNVYSLETISGQPFIFVKNDFSTVKGPSVTLDVFTYNAQGLQPIFSSSEIQLEIDKIDYESGEVTFFFPFANTTVTYTLSSFEQTQQRRSY